MCFAAFVLLRSDLIMTSERCDPLFRNKENESSLANKDISVSLLYPELIWIAIDVDTNPEPVVTDFDCSETFCAPYSQFSVDIH